MFSDCCNPRFKLFDLWLDRSWYWSEEEVEEYLDWDEEVEEYFPNPILIAWTCSKNSWTLPIAFTSPSPINPFRTAVFVRYFPGWFIWRSCHNWRIWLRIFKYRAGVLVAYEELKNSGKEFDSIGYISVGGKT